jgi:hypothetical protein
MMLFGLLDLFLVNPLQPEGDGAYAVGAAGDYISFLGPREITAEIEYRYALEQVVPGPDAEPLGLPPVLDDELLTVLEGGADLELPVRPGHVGYVPVEDDRRVDPLQHGYLNLGCGHLLTSIIPHTVILFKVYCIYRIV